MPTAYMPITTMRNKTMTIYLEYEKARNYLVNRQEFLDRYSIHKEGVKRGDDFIVTIMADTIKQPMQMLRGTPILVNVEGSYIAVQDLLKCCKRKDYGKVLRYVKGVHGDGLPPVLELRWQR